MSRKVTATMFIDRPSGEIEVELRGAYYAGSDAPDDPSEVTDIRAWVVLTEAEEEAAAEKLAEAAAR